MSDTDPDLVVVDTQPDIPDKYEPLNTGRIRMTIAGTVYTLRAPNVGAYSDLATLWDETVVNPPVGTERKPLDRLLDWWEKTFETLGDKRMPSDRRNLPAFMVNSALPPTMFSHWREVPLSPSSQ